MSGLRQTKRPRSGLIETAEASTPEAFGGAEWGLLAAVALLWGSAYLLIEFGLESLPAAAVTALRVWLALAALAFLPAARQARVARADWSRVALLGVLWLALPLTLFPLAQQSVSSATAGVLTGAQPLFAALIAAFLLRRTPGLLQGIGLVLGFLGISAIALATSGGASEMTAVLLVLVAVLCYALSANIAVGLQQRYGALAVLLRALVVASVLVAPAGISGLAGARPTATSVAAVAALGLLSTAAAYVAFTTLVGRAGATRGTVAVYFVPVVAVALGVLVEGARLSGLEVAGALAVLAGALLVSRRADPGSSPRAA